MQRQRDAEVETEKERKHACDGKSEYSSLVGGEGETSGLQPKPAMSSTCRLTRNGSPRGTNRVGAE